MIKKLLFSIFILFFFCGYASAITIIVAGDGSGDYNCDGSDDQVEINEALSYANDHSGTTVYLKGPATYIISDSIAIGNNTKLTGDASATVQLVANANWIIWKPMVKEITENGAGIEISGFKIDGNRGNNTVANPDRTNLLISINYTTNVSIHDMILTNNNGDGFKNKYCTNVYFYNNTVSSLGHDGLYSITCGNVNAWNNSVTCRMNSGFRIYNTNNVILRDNYITAIPGEGGAGIEIEKYNLPAMTNISIYQNTINGTRNAGIWLFGYGTYDHTSTAVQIHHNIIKNTGRTGSSVEGAGILSNGFDLLVENNVIDGAYGAGITQNTIYTDSGLNPTGTGFVITAKNNIILNSTASLNPPIGGTGYGLYNALPSNHSFVESYNCFYNNQGGNVSGLTVSEFDIFSDPLFASISDYHLKSPKGRWNGVTWVITRADSPCIDAGDPTSAYSNEPAYNGGRINIGRYGNTPEASKSIFRLDTAIEGFWLRFSQTFWVTYWAVE